MPKGFVTAMFFMLFELLSTKFITVTSPGNKGEKIQ
jgi:hypothetical protein